MSFCTTKALGIAKNIMTLDFMGTRLNKSLTKEYALNDWAQMIRISTCYLDKEVKIFSKNMLYTGFMCFKNVNSRQGT